MISQPCPFCLVNNPIDANLCSSCLKPFPWIDSELRLTNAIKEREVSRLRATLTLAEDIYKSIREGKPVPVSSIKGMIFSLLMPRAVLIVGSLFGAILLAVQTYLLYRQFIVMDLQNSILIRQSQLDIFDKTQRFREILSRAPIDSHCKPTGSIDDSAKSEQAWPRANGSAILQIVQLAKTYPDATLPALNALVFDTNAGVSSGSLQALFALGFKEKNFSAINFRGASLADSDFSRSKLILSQFGYADLSHVSFRHAELYGSQFFRTNLNGAYLDDADLRDATFDCADLRGAALIRTDVASVSFIGADLAGANLEGLRNWQKIDGMERANITGVRNAPAGFVEWARSHGALDSGGLDISKWYGDRNCKPRISCE